MGGKLNGDKDIVLGAFYPSRMKVTDVYKTKNGMVEPVPTMASSPNKLGILPTRRPKRSPLSQMLQSKFGPKYLRTDNAGENKLFADRIKHMDWKLPIQVEWTARET
jgi:hypothetical protein